MPTNVNGELARLRAKEQLYDELADRLAVTERQLAQLTTNRSRAGVRGVDPAWREIANDLATALRPYTLFREQRVKDGRIVVETAVPGSTLTCAREALDRLGRQVAVESYRVDGIPAPEDRPGELAA
jgi:hypothetical protein